MPSKETPDNTGEQTGWLEIHYDRMEMATSRAWGLGRQARGIADRVYGVVLEPDNSHARLSGSTPAPNAKITDEGIAQLIDAVLVELNNALDLISDQILRLDRL